MSIRYGFAHRGGAAHGPDNTLATFAGALAMGATGLETDAWLTADDEVVLDHDGVVRAAKRRRKPMSQVRRDELPAHMATLDELYSSCGTEFDLAVDAKSLVVARAVEAVARRHGAQQRLWVVTPHSSMLEGLTEVRRAVTLPGALLRTPRRQAVFRVVTDGGAEAVNARWQWWTRPAVEQAHALDLLAFGYDTQRETSLRRASSIGLDGVFSDHVDRLVAALASG